MSKGEIVILDCWVSPFCLRVKIALKEKGLEYEEREEKELLGKKSDLLLKSNPIHQKVPVLLHNGKPICESTVIVNYINDNWPSPPFLPSSPYEIAQARFWADYIDKKVHDAGGNIWKSKGEAQERAIKDFIEIVKQLEEGLGERDFFGGDTFGLNDISLISLTSWFHAYEKFGNFKVEDHCPKFSAWIKRCSERPSVSQVIPDPEKVYEFVLMLKKMFGLE
ncbi:hypothetical protein UlMin_023754 [Ulmus minor]